ncbi:hypothetical protein N0B44_15760 [Roseibacterium beibuensis]|uniref:Uncharacterized protein n=1 Tax=[Roseibacterium] beibuensis TaxID=1193142 RepID=A0ABP9LD51_9RHOB|nr:hypothetical protein [Roseibacterium beibuensis]MCS6624375.1 hypothetical protein [Roseibacterium beibuensis]
MSKAKEKTGDDLSDWSPRNWFAGQALAGMGMWIPPGNYVDEDGRSIPTHSAKYQRMVRQARAEWARDQADALIAALDRTKGEAGGPG